MTLTDAAQSGDSRVSHCTVGSWVVVDCTSQHVVIFQESCSAALTRYRIHGVVPPDSRVLVCEQNTRIVLQDDVKKRKLLTCFLFP